jgi:nucleotide-binding universal stress UspA family protein
MTTVIGVDGLPKSLAAIRLARQEAACRGSDLDAVLIVLAARKEHSPSRLLGAVSQYVLRNAPCPVLVVPARNGPPLSG